MIQIILEGNITLRYLGETQATLTGKKIRSIDSFDDNLREKKAYSQRSLKKNDEVIQG